MRSENRGRGEEISTAALSLIEALPYCSEYHQNTDAYPVSLGAATLGAARWNHPGEGLLIAQGSREPDVCGARARL
jgi:hypothetical protein